MSANANLQPDCSLVATIAIKAVAFVAGFAAALMVSMGVTGIFVVGTANAETLVLWISLPLAFLAGGLAGRHVPVCREVGNPRTVLRWGAGLFLLGAVVLLLYGSVLFDVLPWRAGQS